MSLERKRISRRDFLKLGLSSAVIGVASSLLFSSDRVETDRGASLKNILSEGELAANGIKINQSSEVHLYLRKEILDKFPVFKDAKERRIWGIIITLVDRPFLSWNAFNGLPDDARLTYQAVLQSPTEYPEDYWQKLRGYWEQQKRWSEEDLEFLGSRPAPEEAEEVIRRIIERANKMLEILGDRRKAVEFVSENGTPIVGMKPPVGLAGMIRGQELEEMFTRASNFPPTQVQRIENLLSHPEYLDKFYVYLAVGGERIPNPKYSYPMPDWFEIHSFIADPSTNFVFLRPDPNNPWVEPPDASGFNLRHELFHYDPEKTAIEGRIKSEHDADQDALDSIAVAWKKYAETGDSGDYGFIFISKKGVTVTHFHPPDVSQVKA